MYLLERPGLQLAHIFPWLVLVSIMKLRKDLGRVHRECLATDHLLQKKWTNYLGLWPGETGRSEYFRDKMVMGGTCYL